MAAVQGLLLSGRGDGDGGLLEAGKVPHSGAGTPELDPGPAD